MSSKSNFTTRREFMIAAAAGAVTSVAGFSQTKTLTAGQVIDRIKEHLGVPWRGGQTDTFKSGDGESPVRGIATTVMRACGSARIG